jgi:methylmalonyl-CoA/ethylmalonyl-CoA epimerase
MRLTQVALHADDLDRATAFYTRLLGIEPTAQFDPPGLVFFDLDGVRLLLDRAAETVQQLPSALVYLELPGLAGRLEELRREGVRVETEPHVIFSHEDGTLGPTGTDEWQAFVRDSEGNLIGLVDHTPTA